MIDPDSRIIVHWAGHSTTCRLATSWSNAPRLIRKAGYPLIFTQRMGIDTNSHQCGTAVMGNDPATSVLDCSCKVYDLTNLWVRRQRVLPLFSGR